MSLEERTRMLGLDHQRADIGTIEPGADSGIFGRQWRGRMRTIATATLVVVRGVLFGRWPSGPLVSFGAGFFRLYILEEMVNSILTALACVSTFASTWLILGDSGHHYPWFTVPGWIGSVFAALFARAIAKRGAAKTKGSSLVLWALASFVASGWRCGVDRSAGRE